MPKCSAARVPGRCVLLPHGGGGEILAVLFEFCSVCYCNSPEGLRWPSPHPPTIWRCCPYQAGFSRHSRKYSVSAHLIRGVIGRVSDMWEHLHVYRVFFMEVIVIWDLGAFLWNRRDRNCLTSQIRKLNYMDDWLPGCLVLVLSLSSVENGLCFSLLYT